MAINLVVATSAPSAHTALSQTIGPAVADHQEPVAVMIDHVAAAIKPHTPQGPTVALASV
jgi:hypothetical protein